MTTTPTTAFAYAGTVSHGTLREEDLIPSFLGALADLDPAAEFKLRLRYLDTIALVDVFGMHNMSEDAIDRAGWLLEELFDALDRCAPEGWSFGAHEGDGSDFGFWWGEDEDPDAWDDDDGLTDVEADAMTLASAGWGTDEDYGCYGGEDY